MAVVATDAFTVVTDASLYGRTPTTGTGPWVQHASTASGAITVDAVADRIYASNNNEAIGHIADSPGGADYSVKALFTKVTHPLASAAAGVVGRVDTAALTFYRLAYDRDTSTWYLQKRVTGTWTTLGTPFAEALANADTRAIELKMTGATIEGYVAGTLRINASDSAITAQGVSGVMVFDIGTVSGVTGYALDDWSLENAAGGGASSGAKRLSLLGVA